MSHLWTVPCTFLESPFPQSIKKASNAYIPFASLHTTIPCILYKYKCVQWLLECPLVAGMLQEAQQEAQDQMVAKRE